MQDTFTLLNLMTSKICHDLATPLGALGLGLEMALESPFAKAVDQETQNLLVTSADTAKIKLKFFRALLSNHEQGPEFSEVKDVLQSFASLNKVQLQWAIDPDSLGSIGYRLLLGGGFLAIETLVRGGTLTIRSHTNDSFLEFVAEGSLVQMRNTYQETFCQDTPLDQQNARSIMPFYLKLIASQAHKKIVINELNMHKLCMKIV